MYLPDLKREMRRAVRLVDPPPGRSQQVEVLADVDLDPQLGEHLVGGGRGAGQQLVGVDERQVADQDGDALAEAPGLAPPAVEGVAGLELDVDRVGAPAGGRAVHDVVVHQGEGVQQLQGGAGVDDGGVVRAPAGADVRPVAERRAEALAAGQDQVTEGGEGLGQVGVDRRPALELVGQQAGDARLDPLSDAGQAGGRNRDSRYDSHQPSPLLRRASG